MLALGSWDLTFPGARTPFLIPQSPAGQVNKIPTFCFMNLIVLGDCILGDITSCHVTADCSKLVCLKKSHFNQKNRNAFFFFGWASLQLLGDFHPILVNVGCELIRIIAFSFCAVGKAACSGKNVLPRDISGCLGRLGPQTLVPSGRV